MASQSNSTDTDGEDSEQLNTREEELTENDREIILEEGCTDPEDEDIEREGKEQMQALSLELNPCSLDDYVPDASSPQQCRKREGHVCVCKDCNKSYFPEKNEKEEPEPEIKQSPEKKKDKGKKDNGEGTKTMKHTHTRAVRNKEWRVDKPCSSIDAKIKQRLSRRATSSGGSRGNINLKAVDAIVGIHSGARVCTSTFYTHNHYHACLALSLFYDNGYMQVSGNKKLIDIILTKEVRDALAVWAREEKYKADNPKPVIHPPSADEESPQAQRKNVFKDYASIPIMLMSESDFEARKKAGSQHIRLMMTSMIKAHNLKQGKGNGSSSFKY